MIQGYLKGTAFCQGLISMRRKIYGYSKIFTRAVGLDLGISDFMVSEGGTIEFAAS
jgi:hypothetical protein